MKQILVLAILATYMVGICHGWGKEGHQIVATIAAKNLNSIASGIVTQFIAKKTLSDIAPLPDAYDHTSEGAWSAPCHYVNMPRGAPNFTMGDCPGCCVVKAIQNYTTILSSNEKDPSPCDLDTTVEPCALEFIVHFVGDIHQPLHVGYGDDRGGNTVKVSWFGSTTYNLHQVWDEEIIDKWNSDLDSAVKELETIASKEPDVIKRYLSIMDPIQWADESYMAVENTVYNYTMKKGLPYLGEVYYKANLPVVQQRLIAAGVRLGKLLNTILDGGDIQSNFKKFKQRATFPLRIIPRPNGAV